MSYVTLAQQGLSAAESRNWDEAVTKLSEALQHSTNPAWLIARSKALVGLERYEAALDDADLAWHTAYERNKRDLLATAQYRRGVAFYHLKQFANADYCYLHCIRLIKGGLAMPKEDLGLKFVDNEGFWKATADQAIAEARSEEASKKGGTLQSALGGQMQSQTKQAESRTANAMRTLVLKAMEKLPEDHVGRKLTTTLIPEQKRLAIHKSDEAQDETAQAKPAAAKPAIPSDTPLRLQDFQSNTSMSVSIFSKGVNKEKLKVDFFEKSVRLDPLVYPSGDEKEFQLHLWGEIDPANCKITVTPNKVELSLAKKTAGKWPTLQSDGSAAAPPPAVKPAVVTAPETKQPEPVVGSVESKLSKASAAKPFYPTSSRSGPKNWDKVVEDENSDEEGDMNSFFRKIYKGATPEQQRAMMKSFTESNGTSLSTNWDDVKDTTVATMPPDGVEAKKWE
ncbi:SGS domain-containing protein [Trichoderma austrokoningii]